MTSRKPLVVLLNGPLGIGKSTLGEVLGEAIDRCVTLDGDSLCALNPSPADEIGALHDTICLLVRHHAAAGYDRVVINHYWSSAEPIGQLHAQLLAVLPGLEMRCFLLTLSREENLRRIAARQTVRAIDETDFEARQFASELAELSAAAGELGEPFDVSDPPEVLAARMLALLDLPLPVLR